MMSPEPKNAETGQGLQDMLLKHIAPRALFSILGRMKTLFSRMFLLSCVLLGPVLPARAQTLYQKPPKQVLDVLHAPAFPNAVVNPTRDAMILSTPVSYPSIAYLAEPMLRLAGVRIIPRTRRLRDA